MNTYANNAQENKSQSIATAVSQKKSKNQATFQFVDNRPEAIAQRKLQEMAKNNPQAKHAAQFQAIANNYDREQQQPIQKKENNTGLPDNLKIGMENLSGMSLNDVKVHYNSDKPAQLQAHAYAQGTDIHLGSGQEKHLPHEAWHVVQQKQGRVKPTMQMKGNMNVNDDASLEKEADVMGVKALQLRSNSQEKLSAFSPVTSSHTVAQLFTNDELAELNADRPSPSHEQLQALEHFTMDEIRKLRHHLDWGEMVFLSGMRRSAVDFLALFHANPQPTFQQIFDIERFSTDQLQTLKRFGTSWDVIVALASLTRSPEDIVNLFSIRLAGRSPALQDFINLENFSNTYIRQMIDLGEVNNWENLFDSSQKQVQSIEVTGNSQQFFDEQSILMDQLNLCFQEYIQFNPGRPLRIASFQFVQEANGTLNTNVVLKQIENLVATSIEPAFLNENDAARHLIPQVQNNVKKTLFSAGQFQWIMSNWESINQTHDVYVDVDYYPNRMADAGGALHKDSVGETLFVNLTYNNSEAGASAEYLVDNVAYDPFEYRMPQVATGLIAEKRAGNLADDGSIKGVDLPQRGRISFIDPVIWHATPFYNHRIPELPFGDDVVGTIQQIIDYINVVDGLNARQREDALRVLHGENPENIVTGAQAKAFFRQNEPLRYASRAGVAEPVDTAPDRRRTRARSLDLTNHPDHMAPLEQQSAQARSFIRTWVILRAKDQ